MQLTHGISGFPRFLNICHLTYLVADKWEWTPSVLGKCFTCRRANPCICSFLSFEKGPQGSTGTQFSYNNPTDWQNRRGGSSKADIGVTGFDDYDESQEQNVLAPNWKHQKEIRYHGRELGRGTRAAFDGQECLFLDLSEDYSHMFSSQEFVKLYLCAFSLCMFLCSYVGEEIIHVQIYCKHKESCLERGIWQQLAKLCMHFTLWHSNPHF